MPFSTRKFRPPPLSPDILDRPRLFARLDAAHTCRLVLISAPAGFGKSILAASWLAHSGAPFAWLTVSEEENIPERLAAALLQTIQHTVPQTYRSGLIATAPASDSTQLDLLQPVLDSLEQLPGSFHLVLDDCQKLEGSSVPLLSDLIEQLPPHVKLVLITRSDPPIPLARLRVTGQLCELRAQDLRFEPPEVQSFLENGTAGVHLTAQQVERLSARTEGWIAGIQMAALSLRQQPNPEDFLSRFSGTNRYILDYLLEEVLNQVSPEIQDFLLRTSILEQMCEPLCQALQVVSLPAVQQEYQTTPSPTAVPNPSVLEMLFRSNVFVLPLDDSGRWYRYHPLFADLLRHRLEQVNPVLVQELHRAASSWFKHAAGTGEADLLPLAIEHAITAKDFPAAASLLSQAFGTLWGRDEISRLSRWFAAIPADLVHHDPDLTFGLAASYVTAGQLAQAEQILEQAGQELPHTPFNEGRAAVLCAYIAAFRGDTAAMQTQAQTGLSSLVSSPQQSVWISSAHTLLADGFAIQGDLPRAAKTYQLAEEEALSSGNHFFAMLAHTKHLVILLRQGRLQQVAEQCFTLLEVMRQAEQDHSTRAGALHAMLSEVLLAQNALEEALQQALLGYHLGRYESNIAIAGFTRLALAKAAFANQDANTLKQVLRELAWIENKNLLPVWTKTDLSVLRFRVELDQNRLAEAGAQLQVLCEGQPRSLFQAENIILLLKAWMALAEHRPVEAVALLEKTQAAFHPTDPLLLQIEALILLAVARSAQGEVTPALQALTGALELAQEEGFLRPFVEQADSLRPLLQKLGQRDGQQTPGVHSFAKRVLEALPPSTEAPPLRSAVDLVEPLSEREVEILALMAHGLTNKEIAGRLYLTERTVKWHAGNLYGKLGVENRTSALARARALGLL